MTPARPGRLRRAGIAVAYVLFLLAVIEVASRALLASGWILAHLGREDPTVSRIKWVRGHGRSHFQYEFDVYDSLRGWAVAPGIAHRPVFNGKWLTSTPRGVRADSDVPYERTTGRRRIVVLGDSYTFGDEVSNDETYATYLGHILVNADVINLGVHGYGHDQMLAYLRTEGIKYRPDAVVLGYVWFDQYRNLFAFTNYAKPAYVLRGGRLVLTGVPVPPPAEMLARERWRSGALDVAHILEESARWRLGRNQALAADLTRGILDELMRTTRAVHAVPVLVYLPVLHELADTSAALSDHERFLKDYCDQRGVACLFLRPVFARVRERGARFSLQGHWDAAAHLVAARALAAYLVSQRLADTTAATKEPLVSR